MELLKLNNIKMKQECLNECLYWINTYVNYVTFKENHLTCIASAYWKMLHIDALVMMFAPSE